jgi:hypothetical protein
MASFKAAIGELSAGFQKALTSALAVPPGN